MVLKKFSYIDNGKIKIILLKKVPAFSTGLMFKRKSPPILFKLKNNQKISFTSIFCRNFYMIILDENRCVVDKIFFNKWRMKVNCYGKYFIESLNKIDGKSSIYRNI